MAPEPGGARTDEASQGGPRGIDVGCVVCRFVAEAVERRIFFLFAEAVGESWFVAKMRAGGFCTAHVRHLVSAGRGPRLTGPFEDVLNGWLARRRDAGGTALPSVGEACPICETATWATNHALGLLASGDARRIEVGLGRSGPLCLIHLDRLIDWMPWQDQVAVARRWAERLLEAVWLASEVDAAAPDAAAHRLAADRPAAAPDAAADRLAADRLAAAVAVLAGPSPMVRQPEVSPVAQVRPGRTVSTPEGRRSGAAAGWHDGLLTEAGLLAELAAGRCPVCTAGIAAQQRLLTWLAEPAPTRDHRDLDALCGDHLRQLARLAPASAASATRSALERRLAMLAALPTVADRPPLQLAERVRWAWRRARARGPNERGGSLSIGVRAVWRALRSPRDFVAEPLRRARVAADRECVACRAAITARRRSLALLGATLRSRGGRDRFERSGGLCLRHTAAAAVAGPALGPVGLALVGAVAEGRVVGVRFELEEALRKSSWSVRYEPVGPEVTAWRRAILLVLGNAALPDVDDSLAVAAADETDRPRRAV